MISRKKLSILLVFKKKRNSSTFLQIIVSKKFWATIAITAKAFLYIFTVTFGVLKKTIADIQV